MSKGARIDATVAAPVMTATAMMPTPEVSATRENWEDWAGPDAPPIAESNLVTRDDLVASLQQEDVEVTTKDLLYWQSSGFVPYPTKRREGRTSYAVYAPWVADLIRELRSLQQQGKTLEEIGGILRGRARVRSATGRATAGTAMAEGGTHAASDGRNHPLSGKITAKSTVVADIGNLSARERVSVVRSVPASIALSAAPKGFTHLATAIAHMYEEEYGTKIIRVEISLTDANGAPLDFAFAINSPSA